jgi:hypothetical protein
MGGAVPPLPQYAFMAWCSGGAQGQLYLYLFILHINMDVRETWCEGLDCIEQFQYRVQWWIFVNVAVKLRIP